MIKVFVEQPLVSPGSAKYGEEEVSRKDCSAHMGPEAKQYTYVLKPICFDTKHLNQVLKVLQYLQNEVFHRVKDRMKVFKH